MSEHNLKELYEIKISKSANKQPSLKNVEFIASPSDETLASLAAEIRKLVPKKKKISFVFGNFNIVHPGHSRLLTFAAECADFLVVGVNDDSSSGTLVPQHLRVEGVRALGCVDLAIALSVPPEKFIHFLKPDIVVKGREHEQKFNPEQSVIEQYGGKLLFSSGETRFSSMELLRLEVQESIFGIIKKPLDYIQRHKVDVEKLSDIASRFANLSVVVIGDLIVDEYVTCDPLGISKEDPTIVVTPIKKDIFVGGAGIVAAHARGLGAKVNYFSVVGKDEAANFAEYTLKDFGVETFLVTDTSRPTTLKQRFRADGKTLLRVSHLRHHTIDSEVMDIMFDRLRETIKDADLLVFSDFNYGCLPQNLVNEVISFCKKQGVPMVADSQSSSQIGDVSRFNGMLLITPTEYEARLAVRDQSSGLIVLAESLRQKANAEHIFITMGSEGLFIHSPQSGKNQLISDQLPALNTSPKDVAGGGDSLLICTSLALVSGANIWESAYLGSVAAGCHVARIGNLPLSVNDILKELYL